VVFLAALFIAPIVQTVASVLYYSRHRTLAGLGLVLGSVGGLAVLTASQYAAMFVVPSSPWSTGTLIIQVSGFAGLAFGLVFAFSLLAVLRSVPRAQRTAQDASEPGAPV